MRKTFILLLLLGVSIQLPAQQLLNSALAKGVSKNEPTVVTSKYTKGERAYCWIKYTNGVIGKSIKVEWHLNGRLIYTSKLSMKYTTARTYSYKTLYQEGIWKAVIKAADGSVLKTMSLACGESFYGKEDKDEEVYVQQEKKSVNKGGGKSMGATDWKVPTKYTKDTLPPSIFLYPENYDPTKKYPVLIALPATFSDGDFHFGRYMDDFWRDDNTAVKQRKFREYLKMVYPNPQDREKHAFIAMITTGEGSTADHSWQGFSNCIDRYDLHIQTNLKRLPSADLDRLYLSGFSLGGDLSWALLNRYPNKFKGVIAAGTRCSATKLPSLPKMKANGVRIYFGMGEKERSDRIKGMEWAVGSAKKHQITHIYYRIPGAEHQRIDDFHYRKAIRYVMAGME